MSQRGLTFIELLVALVIMGVVLGGLMSLWTFGFNTTRSSQDLAAGYNIARLEIEKVRTVGYMLHPEGARTTAYDGLGQPTEGAAHFLATTKVETLPDKDGLITMRSLREVTVQVVALDTGRTVFTTKSCLTKGGI